MEDTGDSTRRRYWTTTERQKTSLLCTVLAYDEQNAILIALCSHNPCFLFNKEPRAVFHEHIRQGLCIQAEPKTTILKHFGAICVMLMSEIGC